MHLQDAFQYCMLQCVVRPSIRFVRSVAGDRRGWLIAESLHLPLFSGCCSVCHSDCLPSFFRLLSSLFLPSFFCLLFSLPSVFFQSVFLTACHRFSVCCSDCLPSFFSLPF